jgi:nanoRNase/pAp phosphatase (c-di-AMP/oligoRNAs hydrolase)
MKDKILIYHDRCSDGFGSRWAFETKYKDSMEYVPMSHGDALNVDITDREVYIADFSFPRNQIIDMKKKARDLILIDHHLSAKKDLYDLPYCKIDLTKSGAVLSWMYTRGLETDDDVPQILKFVQDRDLYAFTIPDTELFMCALDSNGFDINIWSDIDKNIRDPEKRKSFIEQGHAISKYKKQAVEMAKKTKHLVTIDGHTMWACNSKTLHSFVATSMLMESEYNIACAYFFDGKKYIMSLRSSDKKEKTPDVSLIAGKFGGGGHRNAAGFSLTIEQFVNILS